MPAKNTFFRKQYLRASTGNMRLLPLYKNNGVAMIATPLVV